jgi:hypothetical protein
MADTTTTTYGLTKPEVGASEDTWGTKLNTNLDTIDDLLDGTTAIAPNLSTLKIGGTTVTSTVAELNILDGVTSTTAELNILDGVTATTAELNILDGVTATTAELNYVDGVTSAIQTQLDGKASLSGANFTGAVYSTGNMGYDSNDYISWSNNAYMNITINGSNEFRFESDGDFHADGNVIAYSTTTASDERLKDNIQAVADPISKVKALRGVTFTWKRDDQASAGVIAQDVQKVLPEAVKEVVGMSGDSHLAVNYGALASILIEAVKELASRVEALEAK